MSETFGGNELAVIDLHLCPKGDILSGLFLAVSSDWGSGSGVRLLMRDIELALEFARAE